MFSEVLSRALFAKNKHLTSWLAYYEYHTPECEELSLNTLYIFPAFR